MPSSPQQLFSLLRLLALSAVPTFSLPQAPLGLPASPTVTLDYGTYQGSTQGDVTSFLGMRYAQPPLGNLRFAAPQEPEPFSGVVNATVYGLACPQQPPMFKNPPPIDVPSGPSLAQSEDCLKINVIQPASAVPGHDLPVLVWLYGGGFESGDASLYNGSLYVSRSQELGKPIIFVSLNYRLNSFGFLASQEVLEANATNAGLRDQRLALEWVNKYISAFGGDPSKVTIWGESAGALSVALHLVWNNGKNGGLFRAAVMESGPPGSFSPVSGGQQYYDQLVEALGCSGKYDTLACLRAADYEELLNATLQTPNIYSYQSLNEAWEPRIDGKIVLRNPMKSIELGLYAKVPVIIGDCYDEGTLFSLSTLNITTDAEFLHYVQMNYIPVATDEQIKVVGVAYPSDPSAGSPYNSGSQWALTPQFKRLASFQGDWIFQSPRRYFLKIASRTQNAWSYQYQRGTETPYLGAFHASDTLTEFFAPLGPTDYIGPDALIFLAANLDPNAPDGLPDGLTHLSNITWHQWNFDLDAPPLLTFIDPAPSVNITTDTFRAGAMELLNTLMLQFP